MSQHLEENYQIIRQIGKGGMGEVFLAKDLKLDREVALKILNLPQFHTPELVDGFIERFAREAKAVARLNHPNIVTIYDISREDNHYYLVMEYIHGKNLSELLQNAGKRFSPGLVYEIALQICQGLSYSHEQGIIHRDIKPENIMFTRKHLAKLTDFGIAKMGNSEFSQNQTQAGQILGSIAYASPEQLKESSRVNQRTDIYSLGISLYELLVGHLPFEGKNAADLIVQIMGQQAPSPHSLFSDIPESFSEWIMKAIEKDPNDRFQNMEEMLNALKKMSLPDPVTPDESGDKRHQTQDYFTVSNIQHSVNQTTADNYTVTKFLQDSGANKMQKSEILSKLRQAKTAHIKWRSYAQALVAGIPVNEDQLPVIHTECAFGNWYYGEGQMLADLDLFTAIETPHEMLHQIYIKMYQLLAEDDPRKGLNKLFGSKNKAKQIQKEEAEQLLAQLISVSETLLEAIKQLEDEVKGLDEARWQQYFVNSQ